MADRVFCIDFGNAFTKVALRADPTAEARLLNPPDVTTVPGFCVPTVVSVERGTENRQHLDFGSMAAERATAGNIRVYRNWKRGLFLSPTNTDGHSSALEAMLASQGQADLATRFGVEPAQLTYLRQMVVAARGAIGGPVRSLSPQSQEHRTATILAPHFFQWLRRQTLAVCDRLPTTGLKYEAIPVRVTVPAFAHGRGIETHPGCQAVLDAVARGGWPLHPDQPLVTEPYSNVIGILTKGRNLLRPSGRSDFGRMFNRGPIVTALGDPTHYPSYRALVIDVGAFTTDFARIDLNTRGETLTDLDAALEFSQHSVPVGVSDLDGHVRNALSPERAAWVQNALGTELETFRRRLYAEGRPYATNVVGQIGAGAEGEAVREAIQAFGRQLATVVAEFCEGRPPLAVQELILTGGGSAIPVVRDALQQAALHGGNTYVRMYVRAPRSVAGGTPITNLDPELVRGGSAIGGTSIYFERSYY